MLRGDRLLSFHLDVTLCGQQIFYSDHKMLVLVAQQYFPIAPTLPPSGHK